MEPSPPALLKLLRSGDPSAFDVLYGRYRSRLYTFLLRLTGRKDTAEDLHQETWLKVARNVARLDPRSDSEGDLEAWLFTVARNTFRSHWRWSQFTEETARAFGAWAGTERVDTVSPLDHLAGNELQRRAEQAVSQLPLKYREVLLLVVVERLEPIQVARVLALTPEAVRQRLSRARGMLQEQLELTPLPSFKGAQE